MDTSANHDLVAICSVTEMARKLGLSRARLYQLVETGVFPPPAHFGTQRPFYPCDLQQKCLEIRKTGVRFNGLPVLFNKRRKSSKSRSMQAGQYDGLVAALKNIRLKVNANAVKRAVSVLYPAGWKRAKTKTKSCDACSNTSIRSVKMVSNSCKHFVVLCKMPPKRAIEMVRNHRPLRPDGTDETNPNKSLRGRLDDILGGSLN